MITVGIDIGKEKHAVAAINSDGEVLVPPRFFGQNAAGFATLLAQLGKLGRRADIRIGMEEVQPVDNVTISRFTS
ncbi:MAG: transposase [Kiritimatiellae bacterium]|nr:transposase [Kiritimatiellia bacterium]